MDAMEEALPMPKRSAPTEKAMPHNHIAVRAKRLRETGLGLLFLAPSLAVFAVFCFYPLLRSVYLSMQVTNPRGKVVDYVGLANFQELFASETFYRNLAVTGQFTLYTVPTAIVLALILAALTAGPQRGMKLFQGVFSMPVAISVGTGAVIWTMLFHPTTGMFNYFLTLMGLNPVAWLSDPAWALVSVSVMTVWMNLGFAYIVLLSGIQAISADLQESARIDGAGRFTVFCRITLPLLSPTLFFLLIVSVIQSLQAFGQFHIMTKGGPMHATDVFVYGVFREAFVNYRFGTASAEALVLFAIILVLTLVQFAVLERKVHYQ
ncbi:glycerol-3-phosphate ABC transporter permease [Paenibacillus sp. J31TS4]|uniref:carbohydrate ABC transporter permease n=1 Tax=Paenibacillus sp. J31TS4 TaxID=2807195 RepID=UPI001B127833|nr:sugar ABC transporter permease [Paenibacillus sp. J31TS4]GIP40547.1 glycerol-3-phosphate ABC transporter permease [Paenibacillus sp. J31TS4]